MKNGDYILVIAPEWFKGKRYRGRYCYEHHLVWERETGLPVPEGCIIHHKDHDKHNNVIENLQLMPTGDHARLHKRPKKKALLRCPNCGEQFVRDARNLPFRNLVFCSRHCVGKYFGKGRPEESKIAKDKEGNIIEFFLE